MPTISEVLAEWDKWLEAGFWSSRNDFGDPDLTIPALMAGDVSEIRNGPAFVTTFAKFGGCVTCFCEGDRWGKPTAQIFHGGALLSMGREYPNATLDYDESYWACKDGKCRFIVAASALEPPSREVAPVEVAPAVKEVVVTSPLKAWQMAASDAGLDFAAMDEKQIADFRAFFKQWQARSSGRLTPDLFASQWAAYIGELQSAEAAVMA